MSHKASKLLGKISDGKGARGMDLLPLLYAPEIC